jgi:hypothetical protein
VPENETEVVRPLNSDEVKDAIAMVISDKVRASLDTTCWLYGMAWPKFKATWRIDITLENFGQEQETFVTGQLHTHEFKPDDPNPVQTGAEIRKPQEISLEGQEPYTPPNVIRKRHGMPVPTMVKRDDGSTEQKAVIFRRSAKRAVPRVEE